MEAIDIIKQMVEDGHISQEVAEKYCPELAKSDDKIREDIIVYLKSLDDNFVGTKQMDSWIAYLERQGGKKPWSKEDDNMIVAAEALCDDKIRFTDFQDVKKHVNAIKNWLKSLKERVQPQNNYNPYKAVVESIAKMCKRYDSMDVGSLQDFYDNVKVKCKDAKEYESLFPQTAWKPSDKQMELLREVQQELLGKDCHNRFVNFMYELKKLREE